MSIGAGWARTGVVQVGVKAAYSTSAVQDIWQHGLEEPLESGEVQVMLTALCRRQWSGTAPAGGSTYDMSALQSLDGNAFPETWRKLEAPLAAGWGTRA
jgi:hypothetical protein